MSAANEDLKLLLARLQEFDADPLGAVKYLKDLRDRARDGVLQEKVLSAKDASGTIQILERYPALELSVTKEMSRIYARVEDQIAKAESGATSDITLRLEVVPLEDEGLSDDDFYDAELEAE